MSVLPLPFTIDDSKHFLKVVELAARELEMSVPNFLNECKSIREIIEEDYQ
jgi:hypothetical protein